MWTLVWGSRPWSGGPRPTISKPCAGKAGYWPLQSRRSRATGRRSRAIAPPERVLLRLRPDGADDLLAVQTDIDVAALELRRKSLAFVRKPNRSVGRQFAPQDADIGREGCAYDAPGLFALRKHRRSEGQRHGRRIPNKTPAGAAGGRVVNPWEEAYAASCCSAWSADGPESWPLAAVSRSTNSITAIAAASP
jgi:hypothetical protein